MTPDDMKLLNVTAQPGHYDRGWLGLSRAPFSTEAVQPPTRVNVTCVTPLGEEVASIS